MTRIAAQLAAAVLVAALILPAGQAGAQFQPPPPDLQNRIPAPLPPPEKPPVINGPLSQSRPPGVYQPGPVRSHSQRASRCLHEGAGYGLRGGELDAYTRSCANAD